MRSWHWSANSPISLRGATARPDRGHVFYNGRPLCNAGNGTNDPGTWDINEANVVCKMLGFSRATKYYRRSCPFGDCTDKNFILGGFNCTGQEADITECQHETTPAKDCDSATHDMVGVECDTGKLSVYI